MKFSTSELTYATLLSLLEEKGVLSKGDLSRLSSVKSLVIFLVKKNVITREEFKKRDKEIGFLASEFVRILNMSTEKRYEDFRNLRSVHGKVFPGLFRAIEILL